MGKHRPAAIADPRFVGDFLPADWLTAAATSRRLHRSLPAATALAAALVAGLTLLPGVDAPAQASVAQSTAPATANPAGSGSYTVVRGDTLSKIGAAQGVAWQSIATANGISAPWTIRVGQQLTIPGEGATPAAASTPAPAPAVSAKAAEAPAPAPAATGGAATAVSFALAQVGDVYVYGATGPNSWDCSGLTSTAWATAGVSLPRTSGAQAGAGTATTRANLVPGDLIAYYSPVSHVAMYIGNGQVVQAANPSTGVQVASIDWAGAPVAYRHIG